MPTWRPKEDGTVDDGTAVAFEAASRYFVDCVRAVPADRWDTPGLGSWTVRELVAHGNRAHVTVMDYVERPAPPVPPGSDYFSEASIEARAKAAVAVLGDDPAGAVAASSVAAIELVRRCPPDTPLGTPAGTMALAAYLPSRVAELVVHGLDLIRATDRRPAVPAAALDEAVGFVARRATRGHGVEVLLALTGRASLPDGFNVY